MGICPVELHNTQEPAWPSHSAHTRLGSGAQQKASTTGECLQGAALPSTSVPSERLHLPDQMGSSSFASTDRRLSIQRCLCYNTTLSSMPNRTEQQYGTHCIVVLLQERVELVELLYVRPTSICGKSVY